MAELADAADSKSNRPTFNFPMLLQELMPPLACVVLSSVFEALQPQFSHSGSPSLSSEHSPAFECHSVSLNSLELL
jgi:hypothetical protein